MLKRNGRYYLTYSAGAQQTAPTPWAVMSARHRWGHFSRRSAILSSARRKG